MWSVLWSDDFPFQMLWEIMAIMYFRRVNIFAEKVKNVFIKLDTTLAVQVFKYLGVLFPDTTVKISRFY